MYTSTASVQVLRDTDSPIDGPGSEQRSRNNTVMSIEDFNTQVKLLESFEVIKAVKSRLKEDEIKRLMAPYHDMFTFGVQKTEEEILADNRKIIPERLSLIVRIAYSHPDAVMASKIANLFATEYINFTHQNRVQKLITSIDELRTKVSQQEAKVKDLDKKQYIGIVQAQLNLDVLFCYLINQIAVTNGKGNDFTKFLRSHNFFKNLYEDNDRYGNLASESIPSEVNAIFIDSKCEKVIRRRTCWSWF